MTEYLHRQPFDWNNANYMAVFDEVPLWSAMFGLMMFDHVPLRPHMTVLDLGCGAGFPLLDLAQRYGLDTWAAALARAQRKIALWEVANVRLVTGDGAAIPFPAATFDLIVSNLGINNFQNPALVLQECARVARVGARLVLTTNLCGHMQEFYEVYAQALRACGRADLLPALEAHVRHRITADAARTMLQAAGFGASRVHEQTFTMRYLDGSAFLRHSFIQTAFFDAWREVLGPEARGTPQEEAVFRQLEANLNRLAAERGELALTIPMAYIEAEKA
jgi:arsenite methyltransferase